MAKSLVILLIMSVLAIGLAPISTEWSQWLGGTAFFGLLTWWGVMRSGLSNR